MTTFRNYIDGRPLKMFDAKQVSILSKEFQYIEIDEPYEKFVACVKCRAKISLTYTMSYYGKIMTPRTYSCGNCLHQILVFRPNPNEDYNGWELNADVYYTDIGFYERIEPLEFIHSDDPDKFYYYEK